MSKRPQEPARSRHDAAQTQAEAAELLEVSLRAWEEWEGGRRNMPPQLLLLYRHLAGIERIPFRGKLYPRPGEAGS